METPKQARRQLVWARAYGLGGFVGVLYGIMFRLATSNEFGVKHTANPIFAVSATMTVSFLGLGSLCLGLLSVYPAERAEKRSEWLWPFLPIGPVTVACLLSVFFRVEGLICVLFALPGALICAALGGIIGGLLGRRNRIRSSTLACVVLLPFLLAPLETMIAPPVETRTVANEIRIHAPAEVVWRNIERVPAIAPTEIRTTWAQHIGFPKPVEATLSYEGVGGVRHASFERGLMFIETVTAWEPENRLAFGIKADTAKIPATTLDEHVTIGGHYFDVLDGEYSLETAPDGDTILHLKSEQRLSTDFNAYAGLWTDAVMRTLQGSILEVIRRRCEHQANQ
jgi:hypothetical protein